MRNTTFLFVLLATLFIFTGCSSDDDNQGDNNSPIAGTWSYYRYKYSEWNNEDWIYDVEPISLEFSSNGTFIDKYNGNVDGGGTWSISGNTLTMTYEDDEWGDETIIYEILVLDESTLRIKESYGNGEWLIDEYSKQ